MKRLTVEKEKHGFKRVYIASCQDGCIYKAFCEEAGCNCTEVSAVIARLAEIEGILSDENGEYDIDRLVSRYVDCITLRDEVAELVKAKRERRCFISSVSLGDEVYYIPKFNGNPCGDIRKGHVQAVAFTKAGKRIKIREYHAHNQDFMIGKTVFLTREAAEQALKEYKDGQKNS